MFSKNFLTCILFTSVAYAYPADNLALDSQALDFNCQKANPEKTALSGDCESAIYDAIIKPPSEFPFIGKIGSKFWAYKIGTCALQIEYLQDWTNDCDISLKEVGEAAQTIVDECKIEDGKVGGSRRLIDDGKCNAVLRLTHTDRGEPKMEHSPLAE